MWGRGLLSAVLAEPLRRRHCTREAPREAPRETPREAPSAAARVLSDATELAHVLSGKTCASCPSPLLGAVALWKTLLAGKTEYFNFFSS